MKDNGKRHTCICENLSFLALFQTGPNAAITCLCSESSAQFPGHSQHPWPRKGRKDRKSVGLCVNSLTFAYANLALFVGITSKQKLALFLRNGAIWHWQSQPKLQKNLKQKFWWGRRKTNILKHFLHVYYLLQFISIQGSGAVEWDPGHNYKDKLKKEKTKQKQ